MLSRNIFHPAFLLYFLVLAVELAAQLFRSNMLLQSLHPFAKALLMPLLIYGVAACSRKLKPWLRLLYAALLLSWAGDVLLLFQNRNIFFILGLAAFLLAHVCYVIVYQKQVGKARISVQWLPIAAVVIYSIALLAYLWPALHSMRLPVVFYALAITVMLVTALHLKNFLLPQAFRLVFGGSMLFVISDSLLAINRFKTPFSLAGFLIMLTYGLAQYFIATGLLMHAQHPPAAVEHEG